MSPPTRTVDPASSSRAVDGVRRFALCPWGAVAQTDEGLVVVPAGSPPRLLLSERDTAPLRFALGQATVVVASGSEGRVGAYGWDGHAQTLWPALGCLLSALAVAPDGHIVVGTCDERVLVGTPGGEWRHGPTLEKVASEDADFWAPETRAVGFAGDGSVVAVAGTGAVYVFPTYGSGAARGADGGPLEPRYRLHDVACAEDVELAALGAGRLLFVDDQGALTVAADGTVVERRLGGARSRDRLHELGDGVIRCLGDDGACLREFPAPRGASCVDEDEGVLVVGCTDGSVHWLDPVSGATLDVRQAHHAAVLEVQACGAWVGVMGCDRRLLLSDAPERWAAPGPTPTWPLSRELHVGPLTRARWSRGGADVAVCADNSAVYDARAGELRGAWSRADPMDVWCEGDTLIAYFRGRVDVYSADTLRLRGGADVAPENLTRYAALPSGTLLASVAGLLLVGHDGTVSPIDTGARRKGGVLHHYGCQGEVSADGARAAVAPTDRAGILLSLPDGAWLAELPPKNAVWRFSPDGARLLDARGGGVYDGHTGAVRGRAGSAPTAAAWSRDGQAIARCEADGAWWCDADGARVAGLADAPGAGAPLFSPAGAHLVITRGTQLTSYEGRDGSLRGSLTVPSCHDVRVAFFGEDRVVAFPNAPAPQDPTAWLVDPVSPRVVAPLARLTRDPLHHQCPLRWGDHVLLASHAGPLQLFQLTDGAPSGVLELPQGEKLRSLDVCATSGRLLVALSGGTLLIMERP